MNIQKIVRKEAAKFGKYNLSTKIIDYIILEHTGYPCFWHIPRDGNAPGMSTNSSQTFLQDIS